MTARSVIASTLLGTEPPELPVAYLVHVASLFGLSENRVRVALSRMVQVGELTSEVRGRYRLAGQLLQRQRRQGASRQGRTRRWGGEWHVVMVMAAGSSADVRSDRRRLLARSRLGELREGVWTRPDNLDLELPPSMDDAVLRFTGRPGPEVDELGLVRSLFLLDNWALRAVELLAELQDLPLRPDDLAPGFVLSAAVLRHLQADPLMPAELLPTTWPGGELRRAYDDWDRRYRAVLAEWSSAAPHSPSGFSSHH
ncbi:MAG: PaaX domain-containing protein, C- domain protein [Acidimicrobiales bacterium]